MSTDRGDDTESAGMLGLPLHYVQPQNIISIHICNYFTSALLTMRVCFECLHHIGHMPNRAYKFIPLGSPSPWAGRSS